MAAAVLSVRPDNKDPRVLVLPDVPRSRHGEIDSRFNKKKPRIAWGGRATGANNPGWGDRVFPLLGGELKGKI